MDGPAIQTSSSLQAYEEVLSKAGATKPRRDPVDSRLVDEVTNRRGKLLKKDPQTVGGWPVLKSGVPYPDSDSDGISDAFESKIGLDPHNPRDGQADRDGNGWTNLEEFLHNLAGDNL